MDKSSFPSFPVVSVKEQVQWIFSQPYLMSSMVFQNVPHGWSSSGEYWDSPLWKSFLEENLEAEFPVFCIFYVDGFSLLRNAGTGKTAGLYFTLGNLPLSVSAEVANKLLLALIPLYGKDENGDKMDMHSLFNVLRFQLKVMNTELCLMYNSCLRTVVPVALRFKLFLGDGLERSFLCCTQASGADHFCNRCVIKKCMVERQNIRGYALSRKRKGGNKKVLPEDNTCSALPRSIEEALSCAEVSFGYVPERMLENPLFDRNLMERHQFDPYLHIPSDIGHDSLLGTCRKEIFQVYLTLNKERKDVMMQRMQRLRGSATTPSHLGGRRKVFPTGAVYEGAWLKNMTAEEALTMVAIAPILFRGLADGDLVYALDIHAQIVKLQFSWSPEPQEVELLKELIAKHDSVLLEGRTWIHFCGMNKLHTRRHHHIQDLALLGTLRLANTMGFEAKHQAFKRLADRGQARDVINHSTKRMLTVQTLRTSDLQSIYISSSTSSLSKVCIPETFFPREPQKRVDFIREALEIPCTHISVLFFSQALIAFVEFNIHDIVKICGEDTFCELVALFTLDFYCEDCKVGFHDNYSVLKEVKKTTGRKETVEYPLRGNGYAPKVPLQLFKISFTEDSPFSIHLLERNFMEKVLRTRMFKADGIRYDEQPIVSLTCVF